jgi:hypothetical protein
MIRARPLKRVFDIDTDHCPNRGGALKIIAAIKDPPMIVRILTHHSSGPADPRSTGGRGAAILSIPNDPRSRKPVANASRSNIGIFINQKDD